MLVIIKLAAFLSLGVYRGVWRYVSTQDLVLYTRAVAVGSGMSMLALLFLFRFQGFSRAVFVLDGLLLLVLLGGSRMAFRLFRSMLVVGRSANGRRGTHLRAGDGGEMLARELLNNPTHQRVPVGFADDDPLKRGSVIHGLRVFGGNGALCSICKEQRVEEVLISSSRFTSERLAEIRQDCAKAGVGLTRMRLQIEPMTEDGEE